MLIVIGKLVEYFENALSCNEMISLLLREIREKLDHVELY